jgi:hypothetical protein
MAFVFDTPYRWAEEADKALTKGEIAFNEERHDAVAYWNARAQVFATLAVAKASVK